MTKGVSIGPYVIERLLGAGAFGEVYAAHKRPLGKRVALKVLHPDKAQNPKVNARFVQEAQAAASLKHPHIVDVDDVGVVDEVPYIAMEFLDGEPLSNLLKREGPIAPVIAVEILLPVCSAVMAVHARGIVHRDLKPDNIFLWKPVAGQIHPKVLDFGIAKVREGESEALTMTGATMGTPRYMSPEQWGGSKYATGQSDQWALGVILYECLTGRPPFEAEELPALMVRISTHPPAPMRATGKPDALERIVARALQKEPRLRYSSVREFGRALLPFADAATSARWRAEFGGEDAGAGSDEALDSPPLSSPAKLPDTFENPSRTVFAAPQFAVAPRVVWALAVLGALGLLASAAILARAGRTRDENPPARAVTTSVATVSPVMPTARDASVLPTAAGSATVTAVPMQPAEPPIHPRGPTRAPTRSRPTRGAPSGPAFSAPRGGIIAPPVAPPSGRGADDDQGVL